MAAAVEGAAAGGAVGEAEGGAGAFWVCLTCLWVWRDRAATSSVPMPLPLEPMQRLGMRLSCPRPAVGAEEAGAVAGGEAAGAGAGARALQPPQQQQERLAQEIPPPQHPGTCIRGPRAAK